MESKYDVKNTKEMLDFILAGIKAGVQAKADGKLDLKDLTLVLGLVPTLQPAFDDMSMIPKELGDMDVTEAAEVVAHVMANLAITEVHARAVIEKSLKAAASVYDLVSEIVKK